MQTVKKMFGIWTTILFVFVVLAAACSSESGSSKDNNHGSDASEVEDVHGGQKDVATDTEQDVEEEGSDISTTDTSDDVQDNDVSDDVTETDTSDDVQDDVEEDTSDASTDEDIEEQNDVAEDTDAPSTSEDPYEDRPQGQCNEALDCEVMAGGSRSCTRTAPGGLCAGCGDGDCGSMAECKFGTCQAICTSKEDCAPGLTCLSGGTCGIERCVNNVCPTPMFGCTASGYCERVACTQQSDCPALTTCTKGLCIENRQL